MLKYYMNAPCKIIREINSEFSEIQVFPKFRDDLEGRMWCSECMVGNNGTPTKHTCDEYQDVIWALEDIENSMLVIVENRLIADEPIELKEIKKLSMEKQKLKDDIKNAYKSLNDVGDEVVKTKNELKNLLSQIEKSKSVLSDDIKQLEEVRDLLTKTKSEYILHIPQELNITKDEYSHLIKRDFILEKLEKGGVDNWEWYSESYPTDEELEAL